MAGPIVLMLVTVSAFHLATEANPTRAPAASELTPPASPIRAFSSLNPHWTNMTSRIPNHPPPSAAGVMAYDAKGNYTLLFLGYGSSNNTWKYAGGNWTQLHPATSPSARSFAGMTYDAKDGYILLWGGEGAGWFNDTWKFVNGSWIQIFPKSSPPAYNVSGMTYDKKDGYVVLLLRYPAPYLGNNTWIFSRGAWTQLHIKGPNRFGAEMTYDARDGYVLLFGGWISSVTNPYPNTTWRFSNGVWGTIRVTGLPPSGRVYCSLNYDPALGKVVLFGGYASSSAYNDTWEYSGGAWINLALVHSPPGGNLGYWPMTTYDRMDHYILYFGGTTGNGSYTTYASWRFA